MVMKLLVFRQIMKKLQKNFSDKFNFGYSLLCDEDKKIINDYGVWGTKKMYGKEYMGIIRKTFVIDENGKISQIIEKVKTKEHSSQILGITIIYCIRKD